MFWIVTAALCIMAGIAGLLVGFWLGSDYERGRDEAPAPWGE